ncbi:hypothetical protein GMORB2_6162 [Geosmithia morbida]|uniref:Uncharacterized protein n=1 Tax=Geosmithia morbida TaxID=1094350 RepID=A0A9P4YXC4_9HYPO|nr:uncharacterized protein GMORB2_6162 [Geosmithia morbida]KAF4123461.1 hypothetical protein GMORB2_6162 [Geosmithia morbida]
MRNEPGAGKTHVITVSTPALFPRLFDLFSSSSCLRPPYREIEIATSNKAIRTRVKASKNLACCWHADWRMLMSKVNGWLADMTSSPVSFVIFD